MRASTCNTAIFATCVLGFWTNKAQQPFNCPKIHISSKTSNCCQFSHLSLCKFVIVRTEKNPLKNKWWCPKVGQTIVPFSIILWNCSKSCSCNCLNSKNPELLRSPILLPCKCVSWSSLENLSLYCEVKLNYEALMRLSLIRLFHGTIRLIGNRLRNFAVVKNLDVAHVFVCAWVSRKITFFSYVIISTSKAF